MIWDKLLWSNLSNLKLAIMTNIYCFQVFDLCFESWKAIRRCYSNIKTMSSILDLIHLLNWHMYSWRLEYCRGYWWSIWNLHWTLKFFQLSVFNLLLTVDYVWKSGKIFISGIAFWFSTRESGFMLHFLVFWN